MFFERRTDKTIISKRFPSGPSGQMLRIASHIVQGQPGLKFATVKDEIVLRQTPSGRYEIKATFVEDDRSVRTLTIQRYSNKTGPLDHQHFTLVGSEVETLLNFVAGVKSVPFDGSAKVHLTDDMLRDIILNQSQASSDLRQENSRAILGASAAGRPHVSDLVAVGVSPKATATFRKTARRPGIFCCRTKSVALQARPEDVWQKFFEANTWIFGYGLSYQFLSKLDEGKLEQIGKGARSDRSRQAGPTP